MTQASAPDLDEMLRAATADPELLSAAAALAAGDLPVAERALRARLKQHPTDVPAIRMLAEQMIRLAGKHPGNLFGAVFWLHRRYAGGNALAAITRWTFGNQKMGRRPRRHLRRMGNGQDLHGLRQAT